jgi:hypothetical protein
VVNDPFAQERESCTAVHLSLDHLDFVDVAFHGGRAIGQGQAGGDGLLVAADAAGEGAEPGQVAGLGLGEPVFEFEQALGLCGMPEPEGRPAGNPQLSEAP